MATSTLKQTMSAQTLTTGATLIRSGNVRVLSLSGWNVSNAITIPTADRPQAKASGMGGKARNTGGYIGISLVEVETNGTVSGYVSNSYGSTTGWSVAPNTDIITCNIVWTI